ncbi:MAG: methyltransferase domain-containing protein [Luteitalea sp.]|nr:methyltransferase domain-containing protein [Luteitalea sp.]
MARRGRDTSMNAGGRDWSLGHSVPRASSLTHEHLATVVATEAAMRGLGATVRVLDAGCGSGAMLAYMARALQQIDRDRDYELYGFDITDRGAEGHGFHSESAALLSAADPRVDWTVRISAIRQCDPWPYPDQSFDVVVSNQVLEHVFDHHHFFGQLARVLRAGAFSAHLFPLKHYVYEGHLFIPYVHRVKEHDLLRWYIKWLSRLGFGNYRQHRRERDVSLDDFSERHADYMHHFTNYLSTREVMHLAKMHGLRASFRYTPDFYGRKVRDLLGRPPKWRYHRAAAPWQRFSTAVLKYANGISLFLENQERYSAGVPGRG